MASALCGNLLLRINAAAAEQVDNDGQQLIWSSVIVVACDYCRSVGRQLMAMRDVMQGDENNPKVPMENNCRLQMPTNNRVVRTNINFRSPVSANVNLYRASVGCSNADARRWYSKLAILSVCPIATSRYCIETA